MRRNRTKTKPYRTRRTRFGTICATICSQDRIDIRWSPFDVLSSVMGQQPVACRTMALQRPSVLTGLCLQCERKMCTIADSRECSSHLEWMTRYSTFNCAQRSHFDITGNTESRRPSKKDRPAVVPSNVRMLVLIGELDIVIRWMMCLSPGGCLGLRALPMSVVKVGVRTWGDKPDQAERHH